MTIPRRTFLAGSAAAVVGACSARLAAAHEIPTNLDIIDCHTHFYDPQRPEGVPWPAKGSSLFRTVLPKDLRQQKMYRKVTGTVVVEASPRVEDNTWLLNLAKDDPFVVGIVGSLAPTEPEFAANVKRFAANPLFRGIRVSVRVVADLLKQQNVALLKPLADHDLALDVNGGPDTPAVIAELAPQLPSLRIVLNHIGNVRITAESPPESWKSGIQAAAKNANVFCKISALVEGASNAGRKAPTDLDFYRPYVDVVWNAWGEDRVIYGSNWPVSERAADYDLLQKIVMDYVFERGLNALEKFCATNAKRAYQWIERPGRR